MTVRSAPTWLVDAARTALEEARVELARAEEMARPMRVSVEEAAQFERIHAAVVDAEAKADRRFGGPMARRRLEKALADERELLLKFGLPSYTAFLLRTMPISSDSAGARHLDEARRAMADAEAVWEELHQAEYPEDLAALEQQEARILAQAAALLGADRMKDADVSSPAATLRSIRAMLVETTASDGDTGAASRRLAQALEAAFGLTVDVARTDAHELLAQADEQIAASDAVAARRDQLALQLQAVLTDIEALEQGMAPDAPSQIPDAAAIAEAEAAATVAEELAEAARHRLERTAIAAGIAPAAAAVAADAAVLDAGSADAGPADAKSTDARPADAGPAGSGPSGAGSTDAGRADSAAGEVDWEAQAVAEVERSQQEIDALGLEMAALEARRVALHAQQDRGGTEPDEGRITRLSEALDAAETTLSAARREADEAAARAAEANESLNPADRNQARPVQEERDEDEEQEGAGARRDALAQSVATLEAAVSAAEAEAVIAAAAVADAERIAAEAAAALEAGQAAVDAADIALAQARHAHDQAEAAHRDAAAACADAEARRAAAAAAVEQARHEVERAAQERDAFRAQLVEATARLDAERSAVEGHRQALSDAERVASARAAEAEAAAEVAAREAARQAEQWQRRYDEAVAAEADASAEETRATRRVADDLAELDAARVALADAEAGMIQHAASGRAAALQAFVQERLAAAHSKPHLGTVPMILLDPFDAGDLRPVAPLLAAAAEEVQMVYLTAEDEVLRWADALGPDRALVLRFGDPVLAQG